MEPNIRNIPIDKLSRGKHQPRRDFEPEALQELADSIKSAGLIQPIVVRPIKKGEYEILAGERRWRAAQLAQLSEITCLVFDYDDEQAAAVTNIENLQRKDLNPIEQAEGFQKLIDEFNYQHEELAQIISKSRTWVTNALRLLKLDGRVQEWIRSGQLSGGHGKVLVGLPVNLQIELAQNCLNHRWSVRKLEQEVKLGLEETTKQPAKINDPDIQRFERNLSDQFGAAVKIDENEKERGGWLKIRYFDYETLAGLLDKMGVEYE